MKTSLLNICIKILTRLPRLFKKTFEISCWIWCNQTQGVGVCVCACVSSIQPKRMNRFWWNVPHMIWQIFVCVFFRGFSQFESSWWCHGGSSAFLRCGTLKVGILVRFPSNLNTRWSGVVRCLLLKTQQYWLFTCGDRAKRV